MLCACCRYPSAVQVWGCCESRSDSTRAIGTTTTVQHLAMQWHTTIPPYHYTIPQTRVHPSYNTSYSQQSTHAAKLQHIITPTKHTRSTVSDWVGWATAQRLGVRRLGGRTRTCGVLKPRNCRSLCSGCSKGQRNGVQLSRRALGSFFSGI